ncbi:MAG: YicC family protein [Deltaproteobacteria bacterium]|nr:YicC family protein [Deltaproteobacteria bacterium]MCK5710393.1 YicC family protein [Deltaproteobacteria bacterium]
MKSMTGYGKSESETKYGKLIVETRSENHRFLDIKFQLPESTLSIENPLSEAVKNLILRGKIRVSISFEDTKNNSFVLNVDLAKKSKKNIDKLKKELGIKEEVRLEHFLMIKEIFSTEAKHTLSRNDTSDIMRTVLQAIKKLDEARTSEGRKLEKDIRNRLQIIEKLTTRIKSKRKGFIKNTSLKLQERIQKILENTKIDEERLYQETAFLAERSDITEELVRLKAHIDKFREISRKKGSIGKELDFLLQEMNREAGTISAKSKDAEISHFIIDLRSEMEKIREQVQNIE